MRRWLQLRALAMALAASIAGHASAQQQQIAIDGSTGTAPLVEALGKAFTAKSGVAIAVGKGLGTKARLEALADGRIEIAMASHGLNVAEVTKRGMTVHRLAMTPVIFGVNESVKLEGLTEAQICSIYAGGTRNWRELGASDLAIAALARPESEVDMEVVREGIACFKNLKLAEGIASLARAGDMARALAQAAGGIGMTSATFVAQSRGKIKALSLNGVPASEENVGGGRYRLRRDSFLIVKNAPLPQVKAFIDFVAGPDGAAVIKANGALPAAK